MSFYHENTKTGSFHIGEIGTHSLSNKDKGVF